jgi:integrase
MSDYLVRRGPFWHFQRWTPEQFRDVDKRRLIHQSTKVRVADDPDKRRAKRVADRINDALEGYWRDLAAGQTRGALHRYRETVRRAQRLGFGYREMGEMIESRATLEIMRRIEALEARGLLTDPPSVAAVLGTVKQPSLMCSELFEAYRDHMAADLRGKSDKQRKDWDQRLKVALGQFVATLPADKPFADLNKTDVNRYRDWWSKRITEQGYSAEGANTAIGYVGAAVKRLAKKFELDKLERLFSGIQFAKPKGIKNKRPSFSVSFLRDRILQPGALDGLDAELRRAVFLMMETGIRPTEIVQLDRKSIHATAAIPYVSVEFLDNDEDGERRELKTTNSIRKIPLVGVALAAMRKQADGFPTYRDNSERMAVHLNKFFRKHKLTETPKHTLYSFRHAFKDRLREAAAGDEMTDMLMGHTPDGPEYGDGFSLERKRDVLQRMALPVPSKLSV